MTGEHKPAADRPGQGRDWRDAAVCSSVDPEIFYPLDNGPDGPALIERARRICVACSVRLACLADVMATEDPARRWGVTGGLTAPERADLFTRRANPDTEGVAA